MNNKRPKISYVENISKGTLVCFRDEKGKLITAKVYDKHQEDRRLFCETKYGAKYVILFEAVEWVKTGRRWPKYIYEELKGVSNANGKERKVED